MTLAPAGSGAADDPADDPTGTLGERGVPAGGPGGTAAPPEDRLLTVRFGAIVVAAFAYFLAMGALLPTVPRFVEDELGGDGLQVGIGVGVFAVSAAVLRPVVGRLGDTKGRRVLAVGGSAIAAVSIAFYGLATTLPLLIVVRLLTGVGEAASFVGFATAAQDLAPDHRRGEAASYFSVALYGGLALGPLLGESLSDHGYGLVWGVSAGVAGLGALLSLAIEPGATVDVAPDRSVLHRDALWPGVVMMLGMVPFTAFAAFIPLFAEDVGVEDVGAVFVLYAGVVLVLRILGARLPDRLGWRRGSAIGLGAVIGGIWLLAAWGSAASIYVSAVGLGIGMSLLYPALFTAVMAAAPEQERSHAVGTFTLFFDFAQGFGAAAVGLVVSLSNERGGFVAAGALAAVGLLSQYLLRARIGRHRPTDAAPAAA